MCSSDLTVILDTETACTRAIPTATATVLVPVAALAPAAAVNRLY